MPDERNDLAALDAKRDAVKGAVDNGIYYLNHATPPSSIERAFHLLSQERNRAPAHPSPIASNTPAQRNIAVPRLNFGMP